MSREFQVGIASAVLTVASAALGGTLLHQADQSYQSAVIQTNNSAEDRGTSVDCVDFLRQHSATNGARFLINSQTMCPDITEAETTRLSDDFDAEADISNSMFKSLAPFGVTLLSGSICAGSFASLIEKRRRQ